jgi:hypothetical protein
MIDIMFYGGNLVFIGTDVLSCSLLNKRLILWNIQWCMIMFYQSWTLSLVGPIVSGWTTRPAPRWPEEFVSAAVGVVSYFLILRHSWSSSSSWKRWDGKIVNLFSTFRDF